MSCFQQYRVLLLSVLAFTVAAQTPAQMSMAGHDMTQRVAVPAPDTLPPPQKIAGIGNSHLAITTSSPEAQMYFDQGLNELHDFWDYESERSFEQSVRIDPNCAMCFWGLAQALNFRGDAPALARQALDHAKKLKGHASKSEKLFIEAADEDMNGKEKKATATYRKLVALDPTSIQARLFLAGALRDGYTDAGEPQPGTKEAISILEAILKDHPDDSAADHYWIHAMEPSNHPERAIESSKRLAEEAPASGHMVHMPGHIFYRTGDYAAAETWFARSTAVDEAYMQAQHIDVDDDWNYVHNLQYSIAALMEEGQWHAATELSAKLTAARGKFNGTLYPFAARDNMARINNGLPIAMRQASWQSILDILADVKADEKLPNLQFFAGQLRTYADGMLQLQQGNIPAAEADAKTLDDQLAAKKPPTPTGKPPRKPKPTLPDMNVSMPDAMMGSVVSNLKIMSQELRASILVAKKDNPGALKLFDEAAKAEHDLGYREPPALICGVRETEGNILLRAGDFKDARDAFAKALLDRPASGLSLYGEARADQQSGNSTKALDEYAQFLAAWKNADPGQPQLTEAQTYIAAHPVVASR